MLYEVITKHEKIVIKEADLLLIRATAHTNKTNRCVVPIGPAKLPSRISNSLNAGMDALSI